MPKETTKKEAPCTLKDCKFYPFKIGCRVFGLGVSGITKCVKYDPKKK